MNVINSLFNLNIVNAILGVGVAATFGTTIISNLVAGALGVSYNIAAYLAYGATTNNELKQIKNTIDALDIQTQLKLVDRLATIPEKEKSIVQLTCEDDITQLVESINAILKSIYSKLEEHNAKWFSSYRGLYVDDDIKTLELKCAILEKRLKLIIESLK